jgi:hypothetical protein
MATLIDASQEFYEVLNEFPVLKDKLRELHLSDSDIKEGLSIEDYFKNKSYSEDEISLLVRKFNFEIKAFLKNAQPHYNNFESKGSPMILEEEEEEEIEEIFCDDEEEE